ncbi:MAG: SusC/RagA family TonB-linked outer membrane protein [Odoribacter sp.]|nr:SusC/RagA family TonB-linked outer membrane protein [Odoribacter sp.]
MKKNTRTGGILPHLGKRLGRWALCLSLCCFSVYVSMAQSAPTVTLNCQGETLVKAIEELRKQTHYNFLFNSDELRGFNAVSVNLANVSLTQALDRLLSDKGLTYSIDQNNVVIRKKQAPQVRETLKVMGKVTDEKGQPLPGVTIVIKGTGVGTATDLDGQYAMVMPGNGGNAVLVYSFVGMKVKEVTYTGQPEINVVLEADVKEMNEVVVTGIFTKAKESYTGAAVKITSEKLKSFRGQNLLHTLKNIDPAINIMTNNLAGSNPNALPEINMRGNSSLNDLTEVNEGVSNSLNTPLIIMDGFEVSLTKLMDYNDDEIESITILKDAAAAAIYGSRSANGVIVVTTKMPEAGKLRVNFSAGVSLEIPDLSSYDLCNAAEKLEAEKRAGIYDNDYNWTHYQDAYNEKLQAVLEGVDTDWLSQPLRVGVGQKYSLRLEGGREEFRWMASLSYNNIEGAMKDSYRNTFNGGVTIDYRYKSLIFKNQLTVGINKSAESKYGAFSDYANMNPYRRIYDENGKLIKEYTDYALYAVYEKNPLYNSQLNFRDESRYTEIIDNFSIEWNIVDELRLKGRLGLSKKFNTSDKFIPADHTTVTNGGEYTYGTGETVAVDANVTLSYAKTFHEKHQLYAGLDYSVITSRNSFYRFVAEGFSNEHLDFVGAGTQYQQGGKPYGSESSVRSIGFTGNVNYTFDNRYFADLSFRMDGSSQFGSGNKFAPFWSAGIGWNLHREHFLTGNDLLNVLRLKASMGQTGSLQFSPYQALSMYAYNSGLSYGGQNGAQLMGLGNEDLKWQVTDMVNAGIELTLWKNRITAEFDYYNKVTSNLLSSLDIPLATGFPSYTANVGKVRNRGYEASLNIYPVRDSEHDITVMLTGKLVYNKNKIVKLSEDIKRQTEEQMRQGADVNKLYFEGRSQNALYAVPSLGIDPSSGVEYFLTRDGRITDTWSAKDKIYMGVAEPAYRGNAGAMLRWKDLTLNLSFAYHWGGKLYNQTLIDRVEVPYGSLEHKNVDRRVFTGRWVNPGDLTFFKGMYKVYDATRASSRFVMPDNVFEFATANLQYRLATEKLKRAGIDVINFGVNMSDIFYWSKTKQERGLNYPFARNMGVTVGLMF